MSTDTHQEKDVTRPRRQSEARVSIMGEQTAHMFCRSTVIQEGIWLSNPVEGMRSKWLELILNMCKTIYDNDFYAYIQRF